MKKVEWYARPAIVLPAVAALVVIVAVLTPTRIGERRGDPRLSSRHTAPMGASLFAELATRTGWETSERLTGDAVRDRQTVHAVLDPVVPLRSVEAHALLEHVREGGGLLLVLGGGTNAFEDSLKITASGSGTLKVPEENAECESTDRRFVPLWPYSVATMLTLTALRPLPQDTTWFLAVSRFSFGDTATRILPGMIGFELGAGRIVIASDPDMFRNDAVRDCRFGLDVAAVRALEFLRGGGDGPRTKLVFDEFHQGHGPRPGSLAAISRYLANTSSGRFLFQLTAAGLILLVATAPRTVLPRDEERIERRSPLEHVDALARAYSQVGGTRTVATRLVHGLRRRILRGRRSALGDEQFLDQIASRVPQVSDDTALLKRALTESIGKKDLLELGPAAGRIESTLAQS